MAGNHDGTPTVMEMLSIEALNQSTVLNRARLVEGDDTITTKRILKDAKKFRKFLLKKEKK